jgi:nitrite reductase/ring-hydroxylating ferredoxin subunit
MADAHDAAPLPDFKSGVTVGDLPDGRMLVGRVDSDEVLLVRSGDRLSAVGAHCTHYHGPLADGLVVGDTVRCPWHHACFSLETGEALRAPALDPIACWRVEHGDVFCEGSCTGGGVPKAGCSTSVDRWRWGSGRPGRMLRREGMPAQ